jgi:two-component system NtrC family sensor kinase
VKNVNVAFFTMIGAIGVLLILTSIFATRVIVRPVYELIEAIQSMEKGGAPTELGVSTDTELGVLQESFNDMSRRIFKTQAELENKVKEVEAAYGELKDTQSRLVHTAKMASLGQLVAGIAHELNNPIGFIYSNMTHLRDYSDKLVAIIDQIEKDPGRAEEIKKTSDFDYIVQDLPRLITSCEEGARRTRDIVIGLRNFSRLDEAKVKRVDLREGIENTLRLISGELKNRVRVHIEAAPLPEVLCYASQVNQVFMNILANAAQAIEGEGDIWINIGSIEKEGAAPARAQISIKDSGKGMTADVIEKIFDPFFTTKSVGQGTGLGLSISYGIIKQHGGDIHVRSEPGKGTEFIITLPIDGPEA